MSYPKTLYGNTVSVPEAGNKNVGVAATAILDDTIDGVDGISMMTSGGNVTLKATSTTGTLGAGATLTKTHAVHKISGTSGAVTLSATTAITNGTVDGEFLRLQGTSATNTVTIQDAANVVLRDGNVTLGLHDVVEFRWDAAVADWIESFRSKPSASTSTLQAAYNAGAGITIGGGGAVNLDLPAGGEVLKIRASTSGNPYESFIAGTAESRLTQVASGSFQVGSISAHNIELISNNAIRLTVLSTGEIGIGGAPETGVKLDIVGGPILLDNNQFLRGEKVDLTNLDLIGMDASDRITVGNATSAIVRLRNANQAIHIDGFNVRIPDTAAATARVSILEAALADGLQVTKNTLSGVGIRVDQDTDNPGIYCQNSIGTSAAIMAEHLQATAKLFQGRSLSLAKTTEVIKEIDSGALSGPSVTLPAAIPAGVILLGMTVRSLVTVTTSAGGSFQVGTVAAPGRWFTISSPFTAGNGGISIQDSGSTDASPPIIKVATDVVLDPNAAETFTAGQVRIAIHYFTLDFPTS